MGEAYNWVVSICLKSILLTKWLLSILTGEQLGIIPPKTMGNSITSLRQYLEDWLFSFVRRTPLLTGTENVSSAPTGLETAPVVPITLKNKQPKSIRPNYFICLKIDHPPILKALRLVQKNLLQSCPIANGIIKPALTSIDCLHVTLMVFHLKDDAGLSEAKSALDDAGEVRRQKYVRGDSFTLKGLGDFRQQVLFAKIDEGTELVSEIGQSVRDCYEKRGIYSTDQRPLNLHATIMKLWKSPRLRKEGVKKILPEWYDKY